MRIRSTGIFFVLAAWLIVGAAALAAPRFPPPDFESGYQLPKATYPDARAIWRDAADVAVLAAALSVAAWLALKKRSRKGMIVLSIFSLAYFGFYRGGCICPIGAIQNVTLALASSRYAVPASAVLFFVLPLAFALVFGRVFCGGVCPLGAIQDLVLIRPVTVPMPLQKALAVFPVVYLGAAVLFAWLDTMYLICRYDPFVAFFRLGGQFYVLVAGGIFLLVSLFVGRPYCRFACPYRVLLGLCSRVAWRHATVTPDQCVVCSLCEGECPFGAIRKPTPESVAGEE
jgi:NosR/NirI family transcriptional regulator, nitrous oxide reductase regulator